MESKTRTNWLGKLLLYLAVPVLLLVMAMPVGALPPRPPRPHPMPTPLPTTKITTSSSVDGGFIRLTVNTPNPTLSAVVQWQDGAGNWHNVTGWRGELATVSTKWWVNPNDFGKGPFRWLVYKHSKNNMVAVSDEFYLPASSQHIVDISITLP